MAKLISKTYGDALLELAVEENKTDELLSEVTALKQGITICFRYQLSHVLSPISFNVSSTSLP